MSFLCAGILCLVPAFQDPDVNELIAKLGSSGFEEQGKAAKALEGLGLNALPALREAEKHVQEQVREWAKRIRVRIEDRERIREAEEATRQDREERRKKEERAQQIRTLIEKLASEDFEEQGKAAEELKRLGKEAEPHLRDALRDRRAGVRKWIRKLLPPFHKSDFTFGGVEDEKGPYRSRFGKREGAILAALRWLARHQDEDGSWRVRNYTTLCKEGSCGPNPGHEDFDTGVTGLALLAFLGAGQTHLSEEVQGEICFGGVVTLGLRHLLEIQDPDGCLGSRTVQKSTYNHLVCTLALCEAYGMTRAEPLKGPAQKALDFVLHSQNPGKAWRYSESCGDNDQSVTGWAVQVLAAAERAGLKVPEASWEGTRNWCAEVTEENGRSGYTYKGTGKVFVPGMNESFDHHDTMTAVGILIRLQAGEKAEELNAAGSAFLTNDFPSWDGNDIDAYYWYYGSLALFRLDPKGEEWKTWREKLVSILTQRQNAGSGCKSGSWEPVDRWSGEGGRVYMTALCAMALETELRAAFPGGK